MWETINEYSGFLLKILAAILCGGMIGLEREYFGKAAGLRTNILICMGATIYMIVSDLVPKIYGIPADPGRIAAQVVSGIGFIGAGSIIRSGATIGGLTTASVIWVVAGIGLLIGIGYPGLAIMITFVVIAVVYGLGKLERITKLGDHKNNRNGKFRDNGEEDSPTLI